MLLISGDAYVTKMCAQKNNIYKRPNKMKIAYTPYLLYLNIWYILSYNTIYYIHKNYRIINYLLYIKSIRLSFALAIFYNKCK